MIRFDRNELAGSFGDVGTDLPLIIGMIVAAGLDAGSVFVVFGLAQITTGIVYGLPMPVQPLKAMAVLVITQHIGGGVLFGAGLAIGAAMLLLTLSGALEGFDRLVPRSVVRGIQAGLGLSLATLALKQFVPALGIPGYALAGLGFVAMAALWGSRRVPGGLFVIGLGVAYALAATLDLGHVASGVGFSLPRLHQPSPRDIATGAVLLALPQLPLSLANSVLATRQTLADLFPQRRMTVRQIGLTYSLLNLIVPFVGGIPVCHGCGGLAGHYALGARTGGSVVLYGSFYVVLGLFFGGVLDHIVNAFPLPILGVVLLFEALTLLLFVRDQAASRRSLSIALLVALVAATLPQGFVIGLLLGMALHYALPRFGTDIPALPP